MIFDDYDSQWYPGMDGTYVFRNFVLQLRKNPRKRPQPRKLTQQGIEPGPTRWEATMFMTEGNYEKNFNQFGQHQDLNSELSQYVCGVMNFDGSWNKSLHLQPLQRCYCENSGSPASACVMWRHYSITYTQSLHTVNGSLAVGRVRNLLCGRLMGGSPGNVSENPVT